MSSTCRARVLGSLPTKQPERNADFITHVDLDLIVVALAHKPYEQNKNSTIMMHEVGGACVPNTAMMRRESWN